MAITNDLIETFLKCSTKCFLRSCGEAGTGNPYAAWVQTKNSGFRVEGTKRSVAEVAPDKCAIGTQAMGSLEPAQWRLGIDFAVQSQNLQCPVTQWTKFPRPAEVEPQLVPHILSGESMTSKYKNKHRAPRKAKMGLLLDRLKSGEAATVLGRLLKEHPDLSIEADGIARSLLHQVEYEDVAAEIEDEIRALDYEDLNTRAGSHEWGYVEPSEAAWEILEETVEPVLDDMKRHIELGLEAEALEICRGLVLGLYRLSEREGGDVLGWAPDFPAEAAGNALVSWYVGADEPKSRDIRRKTRPPIPQDLLSMIPKWIPMIQRILKETK
jgi:hypothetical protein